MPDAPRVFEPASGEQGECHPPGGRTTTALHNTITAPEHTPPPPTTPPLKNLTRSDRKRAQLSGTTKRRACLLSPPAHNSSMNTRGTLHRRAHAPSHTLTRATAGSVPGDSDAERAPPHTPARLQQRPHSTTRPLDHSTTPPTPTPPDFISEQTLTNLFQDYLHTTDPAPEIAARHNLTLTQFIAWHDHPHTQHTLSQLDRIAQTRAEHQRLQSAPAATQALIEILDSRHLIKNPDPARKAANKLLRSKQPPCHGLASETSRAEVAPCHRSPSEDFGAPRQSIPNPKPSHSITDQNRTDQNRTDQHQSDQRRPDQRHPDQHQSDQRHPDQRQPDQRKSNPIRRPEGPSENSRGRKPTVHAPETHEPQRGDTPPAPPTTSHPNINNPPTSPTPEHRSDDAQGSPNSQIFSDQPHPPAPHSAPIPDHKPSTSAPQPLPSPRTRSPPSGSKSFHPQAA